MKVESSLNERSDMPLPPELDRKIRNRFDELIKEGSELVSKMEKHDEKHRYIHEASGHISEYHALVVKSCSLIEKLFGSSERGKKEQQSIKKIEKSIASTEFIIGVLQGLQNDYASGFLDSLEKWISAEINTDYLRQARMLLDQGQSEELDQVLSAVVCGIVLENSLRWLCSQHSPSVKTVKPNGQHKRLNALIDDLQKAKAFNAMKGDQLRGWAKTRNHAAHGETGEFNRQDVQSMNSGVTDFLAEYIYGK